MSFLFKKLFEKSNSIGPKINGCIHIGAHWGQEYETYKRQGIDNIIFYEPSSSTFDILKRYIGSNADLRNVALGNKCGKIEMFIEDKNHGQSSSILEPDCHLNQYPHIKFPRKEMVKITTLDTEIFTRSDFNFINIDVQGYELEVFKGAKETLLNIDYIISEINSIDMYKNCAKVADLDTFLQTFGFIRSHTEWHQNQEAWGWGNALYWKE